MKRIVIAVTALAVLLFALAATPAYSTEKAAGKSCATAGQTVHQDCAKADCCKADCCKDGKCVCCPDGCACCTGGACACKGGQRACCKDSAGKKACDNGGCQKAKK